MFTFTKKLSFFVFLILCVLFTINAEPQNSIDTNLQTDKFSSKQFSAKQSFEPYKYIIGESPEEFNKKLNEWGKKGYRLVVSTKIPLKDTEQSYKKMILAAILKYDGEEQFEYEMIVAYNSYLAESQLNEFAKKGFQYLKTFIFYEGEKDPPDCDGDFVSQTLCRSNQLNKWRIGSLILISRTSGKNAKRNYRVLTGGTKAFVWEESTATNLRDVFNETLKESFFIPVGLFFYQSGARDAIIVEILDEKNLEFIDKSNIQYKIVRNESGGRFRTNVDLLSKDGFRFLLKSDTIAVLAKDESYQFPVTYFSGGRNKSNFMTISTKDKKYVNKVVKLAENGSYFRITDLDVEEGDGYDGKLLFEKKVKDDGKRFDYKIVKLTEKPLYPNKKIKQRAVSPTTETAMTEFYKIIKEGYQVRALYYSNGIAVLFEKEIINSKN